MCQPTPPSIYCQGCLISNQKAISKLTGWSVPKLNVKRRPKSKSLKGTKPNPKILERRLQSFKELSLLQLFFYACKSLWEFQSCPFSLLAQLSPAQTLPGVWGGCSFISSHWCQQVLLCTETHDPTQPATLGIAEPAGCQNVQILFYDFEGDQRVSLFWKNKGSLKGLQPVWTGTSQPM